MKLQSNRTIVCLYLNKQKNRIGIPLLGNNLSDCLFCNTQKLSMRQVMFKLILVMQARHHSLWNRSTQKLLPRPAIVPLRNEILIGYFASDLKVICYFVFMRNSTKYIEILLLIAACAKQNAEQYKLSSTFSLLLNLFNHSFGVFSISPCVMPCLWDLFVRMVCRVVCL